MDEIVGSVKTAVIDKKTSCTITFVAKLRLFIDDIVRLTHEDKTYSFVVNEVSASDDMLMVSALEIGNWAFKMNRKKIDPRDLLMKELKLITDPEVIKRLIQAEGYC